MGKRKRQFIEELIDQVPHEKRPLFKKLAVMERYQYSGGFRFLFFGSLFYICLPLTYFLFTFIPELDAFFESFLGLLKLGVCTFLLCCALGFFLREMPLKLNQNGVHFVHGVFIFGSLICGALLISLI